MIKERIYAVVDLETTGPKQDGSDKIIQFSCDFVQSNKIVNHFSTLINPGMPIPVEVKKLTGIKDKDVRYAPYFDEVAGTIYAMLQNTTFVAHNVNFDYSFLSSELERAGYPELELPMMDTVQLTQIIYPTLVSYRLIDISKYLQLSHIHPHKADSDTKATAELLINLKKRIETFPLILLQRLAKMGDSLIAQTGEFFNEVYLNKKDREEKLPNDLMVVEDIVLKRPKLIDEKISKQEYPETKDEKQNLFSEVLEWRSSQIKMMDDINNDLNEKISKKYVYDAATGIGKTLGYLMPIAYKATEEKVVISTATTTLQNQLIDKDISMLKEVIPFNLNIVNLKGSQHYIDIDKFYQSLSIPQSKKATQIQMTLLVWLMETSTGDMEELNLLSMQDTIFAQIEHHGIRGLNKKSTFYSVDFLKRQEILRRHANIIITNHAYLLSHVDKLGGNDTVLIVDEAQHLNDNLLKENRKIIDFDQIKIISDSLLVKMESQLSFSFRDLVEINFITKAQYTELIRPIQTIDYEIMNLREIFMTYLNSNMNKASDVYVEVPIKPLNLRGMIKANLFIFKKIEKALRNLKRLQNKFSQKYSMAIVTGRLGLDEIQLINDYQKLLNLLLSEMKSWSYLDLNRLEDELETEFIWLTYPYKQENGHLRLNFIMLDGENFLNNKVYQKFSTVLLVGANLAMKETRGYMFRQLDLNGQVKIKKYDNIFDYSKQTRAYILKDTPDITSISKKEYIEYLSRDLEKILLNNNRQTMILFNSLEIIESVYPKLVKKIGSKREILAQGITGSVEKIKKRFMLGEGKILLGAGAFWEGIDLPENNLEMVIVTRLPFQSPDTVLNKARYRKLEKKGINSFYNLALPEAILRLQQGWGRLIRTPKDKGIFVLLDSRIANKNYGEKFISSFPDGVNLKSLKIDDLLKEITSFFGE